MNTNSNKYESIQFLRAIAALLILIVHLKFVIVSKDIPFIDTGVGSIGVDIFFVISGFVMTLTFSRNAIDWKNFLLKRMIRVVPFYWLMSIYFLKFNHSFNTIFNTFAFFPIFDQKVYNGPLHPYGWSLSFELYFYICFAIAIAFFKKKAPVLLMIAFISFIIINICFINTNWYFPHFLGCPLILEFCAGMLIYKFYEKFNKITFYVAIVLAIIMLFPVFKTEVLGGHIITLMSNQNGLKRTFIWGTCATCIVIIMLSAEKLFRIKFSNVFLNLGDASYSLYLIQFYALVVVNHFFKNDLLKGAIYLTASIVGSLILHKFIEKPLINFLNARLSIIYKPKSNLITQAS